MAKMIKEVIIHDVCSKCSKGANTIAQTTTPKEENESKVRLDEGLGMIEAAKERISEVERKETGSFGAVDDEGVDDPEIKKERERDSQPLALALPPSFSNQENENEKYILSPSASHTSQIPREVQDYYLWLSSPSAENGRPIAFLQQAFYNALPSILLPKPKHKGNRKRSRPQNDDDDDDDVELWEDFGGWSHVAEDVDEFA